MQDPAGSQANLTGSTSSGLLAGAQRQDPEAWRRLVRLYTPLVYHWCRQANLQPSDAADVLQEVFQAVARNIAMFQRQREGDTFRGWLWTIARNKLRDHYRQRKVVPEAIGGSDALVQLTLIAEDQNEETESASSMATANERQLVFRQALESVRCEFEERTWAAFYRTTVEGALPADTAAELGISVNAVYKAKSRILARLREELAGLLDEDL